MRARDTVVVIPSLNPDDKLKDTVDGVIEKGFPRVVLVDDGSDSEHKEPFEYARLRGCTVLTHEVNKGKGAAMKTAFSYILSREEYRDVPGAITVDGDGQHRPDDILACCESMVDGRCSEVVLGVRAFDGRIPWKSRLGNSITSFAFRTLCGIRLKDTQTGLRAIPYGYLQRMTEYRGERYEYETNMLLEMKNDGISFKEVGIETVYLDADNSSSHFHPFRDSARIYGIIFKYAASSCISALIDLGGFYVFLKILKVCLNGIVKESVCTLLAGVLARIVSSLCNYLMNRKVVFKCTAKGSFIRYYELAVVQMIASSGIVAGLSELLPAGDGLMTVLKAVVDVILFFVSFRIQKHWVFAKKQNK